MNIYLTGFYKEQVETLTRDFAQINFYDDTNHKDTDMLNCEALVSITRTSLDKKLVFLSENGTGKLNWIHSSGAGIDKYRKFMSENNKIVYTNGKIIQGIEVSDHAMALLLSLSRKINIILTKGMNAKFTSRPIELRGLKSLIVGYGGVGKCLSERAFCFGMQVDVINYEYSPYSNFINNFFLVEDLEKILPNYDVIFLTTPLTNRSYKMLNKKSLKLLKDNCYIINVSRGGLICLESLVKELKNNRFEGVGLDVTDPEPLDKNHDIFKFENVLITPHIAGISQNFAKRSFDLIKNNLRRFSNKSPLINTVNFDREF